MLADSLAKRRLHQRDLNRALAKQTTWSIADLLTCETYPSATAFPAFYGQSASVTVLLVSRGTPSQFVRFVKAATKSGYDRALRDEYSIAGVAQLEQLWKADALRNSRLGDGICEGR